jgi:hypothetical protein
MPEISEFRFATDSPLEGDGFELPVPRVLEPSQFIRLLDTAFAFGAGRAVPNAKLSDREGSV